MYMVTQSFPNVSCTKYDDPQWLIIRFIVNGIN